MLELRRAKAAATVLAAAAAVFAAAPAATAAPAAYPTSPFDVTYTASYARGTATWYNRSVGVTGTFKASNCRRMYAFTYTANSTPLDARSTSLHCNNTAPVDFSVLADVPGGAASLIICLADADDRLLECTEYQRP